MCVGPLAIAMSVAGSLLQYSAASQAADEQNAYYAQNAKNAQQAAVDEYAALGHRRAQERDAAGRDLFQDQIEAMKARSTSITGAGEAGVSGLSVDMLLDDLFAQQGRKSEAIDAQYQMTTDSISAEFDAVEAKAKSRINSVQQAASPSPLPFIVSAASNGLSTYKSYYG